MDGQEMMKELRAQASEKYRENMIRMGIPAENSIGVATSVVRGLAKKAGKSQELAFELWNTKYHEARMLAVLLMNPKATTDAEAERLLLDVVSWDLCDHLCKNLFLKMKSRDNFIAKWIREPQLYKKRAAFVLIAASVIHDKKLTDETVDGYLELVMQYADDGREHVKKAVSTALREIGKKNFHYNEKALLLAHEWMEGESKALRWIGKDAAKELETMVKAEGRGTSDFRKYQDGKGIRRFGMNGKFFALPQERQEQIINAAYGVFSRNSYKNASMSRLADAGGVSKSLLFHYFLNPHAPHLAPP